MPIAIEKQKKIIEILRNLPPEKIDEIIDFAEYLKDKSKPLQKVQKTHLMKIPTFHLGHVTSHAFDREIIYSEHLDRKFD